jgi:hypothetical protein
MTVTDRNLAAALRRLPPAERRAVEAHVHGAKTALGAAALREIRAWLKRKAQSARPLSIVKSPSYE